MHLFIQKSNDLLFCIYHNAVMFRRMKKWPCIYYMDFSYREHLQVREKLTFWKATNQTKPTVLTKPYSTVFLQANLSPTSWNLSQKWLTTVSYYKRILNLAVNSTLVSSIKRQLFTRQHSLPYKYALLGFEWCMR